MTKPKKILTSFEWQVLGAAALIPPGEIQTYRGIAAAIGRPKAARAVGQALKNNPFAPVVPCHRVIRSDGSLGGYQGKSGLAKKEFLLRLEKEIAPYLKKGAINKSPLILKMKRDLLDTRKEIG